MTLVEILILVFYMFQGHQTQPNYWVFERREVQVAFIIVLLLGLILQKFEVLNNCLMNLKKVNAELQILIRPLIVIMIIYWPLNTLLAKLQSFSVEAYVLEIIGFVSAWLLITKQFQIAETPLARFFMIILVALGNDVMFAFVINYSCTGITERTMLKIINMGVLIILTGRAMKKWNFCLPEWRLNRHIKWWVLGTLCYPLIMLNPIGVWSVQSRPISIIAIGILALTLQVSLEEWLFRFVLMGLIVSWFMKKDSEIKYSIAAREVIVIDSILFGLMHFGNLNYSESMQATLFQVSYTFLVGIILAVIYLYSGTIWLPIILHWWIDFFGGVDANFYFTKIIDDASPQIIDLVQTDGMLFIFAFFALWYISKKGFSNVWSTLSKIDKVNYQKL